MILLAFGQLYFKNMISREQPFRNETEKYRTAYNYHENATHARGRSDGARNCSDCTEIFGGTA